MVTTQSNNMNVRAAEDVIPGRMLQPLLRDLAMRGEGRFSILAAAENDLPLAGIVSGEAVLALPRSDFARIYGAAAILLAEAIGREAPVKFSARRDVIAMLVTALAPSTTLREAVERIAQFNAAIAQNGIGITLVDGDDGGQLVVDLSSTLQDPPRSLTAAGMVFLVNVLTWLGGTKPKIVKIGLTQEENTIIDPCLLAMDIPVSLSERRTYLQFAPGALDEGVSGRPFVAAEFMELVAHDPLFSVRKRAPISSRVNALFLECELAETSIPDRIATAEHLQISPSTFHRRLKDEGTSFLALRSAWQQKMAKHLLGLTILNVPAIARRTGFHDARTFRRAFIDWTGQRPSEFRKRK
ncbi:helix-turn-helix domain-containing protein [Sphingomonas sp. DBB INV C78]|uniref:helix-turn-helix domain-containing protein n=1 Tax=Sphingomonas sp. DBB INV C78 TaxID=3349434 RepID=UPI0036D3BE08